MAALAPTTADAAVAPLFDRTSARIGERVGITVGYAPAPGSLVLYLVPLALAPRYVLGGYGLPRPAPGPPPPDPRLVALGSPRSARLSFRVPRLEPGRYTLVVWCKPCGNDHWAMATPNFVLNPRAILRIRA